MAFSQETDDPHPPLESQPSDTPPAIPKNSYQTSPNSYGVYRSYPSGCPSYTPDELYTLDSVSDSTTFAMSLGEESADTRPWWSPFGSSLQSLHKDYFTPFLNASVFRLMHWFYNGSNTKSLTDLDQLVQTVICADDFKKEDFADFRASREAERLDKIDGPNSRFSAEDGWIETSVKISLPAKGVSHASEVDAPQFELPGLFHRRLLQVIKASLQETAAKQFHLFPFHEFWQPSPHAIPQRIYSELYSADAFLQEQERINAQPREPGCTLENVVVGIMLWSDSTHLTSFGNASLWPIYLHIGNLSKYTRSKPTSFAAHHLAYIPKVRHWYLSLSPNLNPSNKLADTLQDFYRKSFGVAPAAEILTHCKRELMQAIWLILLDEEFMHAYVHGLVVECVDEVFRRFFPRFFTYSADYPEK